MGHPAFFLTNGHLTYDPTKPDLCTDDTAICYGVLAMVPVSDAGSGIEGTPEILVMVGVSDSGSGAEDLVVVKIPPRPPVGGRRFGSAPIGGRGCFGGLSCLSAVPEKKPGRKDGDGADKKPSFAETAVEILRSGKGHEKRKKKKATPERKTVYDLRSRLAYIREKAARLEAERRRMVQATEEERARHEAEIKELYLQVALLERDLLDSERQRAALMEALETSQEALEAEREARVRGAILVGAGLGTAGLTLAVVPVKYAWAGYVAAAGLALWGLVELVLPASPAPAAAANQA
jgi:hypothetical protein